MSSMSRLGIGLSVVFGCFLLALVAELYYVFVWRRRLSSGSALNGEVEDEYSSPSRELFYLLCWKKQRTTSIRAVNNLQHRQRDVDSVMNGSEAHSQDGAMVVQRSQDDSSMEPDFVAKFFPVEGMDSEILRIHNLLGPPRFLFTIKEETKEDLDSEDGRSRKSRRGSRSRSLSDLLTQMSAAAVASGTVTPIDNTPFVTPPSSPPFGTPIATPPLTPLTPLQGTLFPRLQIAQNKQIQHHLSPLTEDSRSCSSSSSFSASSSLPCSFPSSFTSSASHSPLISPPPCTTLHTLPKQDRSSIHLLKEGHFPIKQQSPMKDEQYPYANGPVSPPPKFKFLRDAELKAAANNTTMQLNKQNQQHLQQQQQCQTESAPPSPSASSVLSSDEDGSFITIIVGDCNSSSSSLPHHTSPVNGLSPTGHIMPLSLSSPCLSPLFSPLTGSHMKTPADKTEK